MAENHSKKAFFEEILLDYRVQIGQVNCSLFGLFFKTQWIVDRVALHFSSLKDYLVLHSHVSSWRSASSSTKAPLFLGQTQVQIGQVQGKLAKGPFGLATWTLLGTFIFLLCVPKVASVLFVLLRRLTHSSKQDPFFPSTYSRLIMAFLAQILYLFCCQNDWYGSSLSFNLIFFMISPFS